MRFTHLAEWLRWLETLHYKSVDLGLDRVLEVAQRGQLTVFKCPVVTVTGTNGKGSCVALLEQCWQPYRTASYTSPHLLHFNERIKFNAQPCRDTQLMEAFAVIDALRGTTSLTYFEFTTLAALWLFQQQPLDVIILEVGVGGRLDAVNVVHPTVAIITNISLDHCEWLGDSREKIAQEKSGIMRAGCPVVCGEEHPPANLKAIANELGAIWYGRGEQFDYQTQANNWDWHSATQQLTALPLPQLAIANAAVVLMVVELLQAQLAVDLTVINRALTHTHLAGRFQAYRNAVEYIFDVAHNPASAQLLAENLKKCPAEGRTLALFAMLKDKDIANTVAPLASLIDQWFIAGLEGERGATHDYLKQQMLPTVKAEAINSFKTLTEAHQAALQQANIQDRIVVFGSFYTVAGIQAILEE